MHWLCQRESNLFNECLKIKGKRIHNSAICNKREEKKTTETAWNLSSTDKEIILLPTAEVYVANGRKNNSANEVCNGSDRTALEKTLALIAGAKNGTNYSFCHKICYYMLFLLKMSIRTAKNNSTNHSSLIVHLRCKSR